MHILMLIPDGVGVRNFVLGRFLDAAAAAADVSVLHLIPDAMLPIYAEGRPRPVEWHPFTPYRDEPLAFTLRYSLAYAHMHWVGTKSMRYHLERRPAHGSWRTRAADKVARVAGRCAASPGRIRLLDQWHRRVVSHRAAVSEYVELFRRIRPSVVFCSHQRPPVVLPPILAAKSLGIPTATFIFSWDNMTSKGRIAAPFDHYLVWSDLMRQELLQYYPEVSSDRTHIVGTPQFDPYGDEALRWTRAEFFSRVGADPSRSLICFSGNNSVNGPEDPHHVRQLMTFIRSGRIAGRPTVVLRPSPADDGARFDDVRRDYPELIYAKPEWVDTEPGSWDRVLPMEDDVRFLANLVYHSDLNINFGSTMSLDFAVHDKPVVNVAFDVADPPHFGMPLYDFCLQFDHYRPVVELAAARFARSAEELADHVNAYLKDPSLDREGRRRLAELEVGQPLGTSTDRILEALRQIAHGEEVAMSDGGRL
jgi:hypothetical protein